MIDAWYDEFATHDVSYKAQPKKKGQVLTDLPPVEEVEPVSPTRIAEGWEGKKERLVQNYRADVENKTRYTPEANTNRHNETSLHLILQHLSEANNWLEASDLIKAYLQLRTLEGHHNRVLAYEIIGKAKQEMLGRVMEITPEMRKENFKNFFYDAQGRNLIYTDRSEEHTSEL